MTTYKYKAMTVDGRQASGVIQATDEYDAAKRIRQNYPVIVQITPIRKTAFSSVLTMDLGGNKLNAKNLSVVCSQIAITLKSGVPLARCLNLIGSQTDDKVLGKALVATSEDVAGGAPLSDSLKRNLKTFPATFIETIRAGEESGNIERSFAEMADYYEKTYKTTDKIKSALRYPIFVVAVAIVVLIIVMVFVIPALTNTFNDLGGELPLITRIMIGISEFFRHWWIVMVTVILGAFIFWKWYVKTPNGRWNQGIMQLKIPVIGKINVLNGSAEFANTMSMLLRSGLTVDRAVEITSKVMNNYVLGQEVGDMVERLQEGVAFGDCIKECVDLPQNLKEMCAVGEETGELDSTLNVIGEFYTNEADQKTKDALARLEPTMLIMLAVFAGFIVISIYLPMFTMYNLM